MNLLRFLTFRSRSAEHSENTSAPALNGRRASRFTIGVRVGLAFTSVVALVAIQTAVSTHLLREVDGDSAAIASDVLPGLSAIAEIQRNAAEIQIAVLRSLLTTDTAQVAQQVKRIDELRQENDGLFAAYDKTISQEEDRQLFGKLLVARDSYREARGRVLALAGDGKHEEAIALNTGTLRQAYEAFKETQNAVLSYNISSGERLGGQIRQSSTTAFHVTLTSGLLVFVVSTIVAVLIIVTLRRALSRVAESLESGATQVAAAAGQVARSSQTLAEGASQQASSLEETSASLEEMASMTRRNREGAAKASTLAREAREAADTGASDMQTMSGAMTAIKTSSDDVAKIVKTIDEIAFQTNILALNAAVEAARAGAAGAGFAVVADEVRALAQRSALAAKETAEKIEGAIARTTEGVAISQKVGNGLSGIIEKVRSVDGLIGEVNSASTEQSQGIDQINSAVSQMDRVVQSSASNAEETAAAAEELNAQAASMRDAVADLVRLVNGRDRLASSAEAAQPDRVLAAQRRDELASYRPVQRTAARSLRDQGRNDAGALSMEVRRSRHAEPPARKEAPLTFRDM